MFLSGTYADIGYLCAMLPLVEELYDNKEEQKEDNEYIHSFL